MVVSELHVTSVASSAATATRHHHTRKHASPRCMGSRRAQWRLLSQRLLAPQPHASWRGLDAPPVLTPCATTQTGSTQLPVTMLHVPALPSPPNPRQTQHHAISHSTSAESVPGARSSHVHSALSACIPWPLESPTAPRHHCHRKQHTTIETEKDAVVDPVRVRVKRALAFDARISRTPTPRRSIPGHKEIHTSTEKCKIAGQTDRSDKSHSARVARRSRCSAKFHLVPLPARAEEEGALAVQGQGVDARTMPVTRPSTDAVESFAPAGRA